MVCVRVKHQARPPQPGVSDAWRHSRSGTAGPASTTSCYTNQGFFGGRLSMKRRGLHHLLVFGALFAFWVVLSGKLDATHLIMGLCSAALVSALSARHLYSADGLGGPGFYLSMIRWHHVALYLPWLAWEVVKANVYVLKLVLGPRSGWNPQITTIAPDLKSEMAQVILANSITLTPGTVTLDVVDEKFKVHAIDVAVALDLESGTMGRRVKAAFGREVGKTAQKAHHAAEVAAGPRHRRKDDR